MRKYRISSVLNILMALTVICALAVMMLGRVYSGAMAVSGPGVFRFFTIDSNVLLMAAAIVYAVFDARVIRGELSGVPEAVWIFKLAATVSVTVTLLVTVCFLAPMSSNGYLSLFLGSNLYFHLLIPLCAICTLIFAESRRGVKMKKIYYCLIPTVIYAGYYAANVFSHAENGVVPRQYDWYGFVQGGIRLWPVPVIALSALTLILGWLLWRASAVKT